MGRRKAADRKALLNHRIRTRVNDETYNRLLEISSTSNCQSVGELVRRILSLEPITIYHKDISLEAPVQELIRIRSELRAIGVNVNQIVHAFHISDTVNQKMFHALKVAEEYDKVGAKVEILVSMVAELGQKWLQR